METKHTPGPWEPSKQKGTPGHCFQAQVFGPDGKSLACIEPTEDANIATANAKLIAAAPELLQVLIELRDFYLKVTGMPAAKANYVISKATSKK